MKKKNLIVAIVMASMIMGGCGQKTVTSVSEDPTVSEAPMKEDTLEPEESAEDATQSAEESQEATDSSSQAAMQRRKVTRRQRVILHQVAAILPAKEIQQRTTAVRQITIRLHLPGRIHRPYRKVQRIRSLLEFRQNIRCMMEYILTR